MCSVLERRSSSGSVWSEVTAQKNVSVFSVYLLVSFCSGLLRKGQSRNGGIQDLFLRLCGCNAGSSGRIYVHAALFTGVVPKKNNSYFLGVGDAAFQTK